MPLGSYKSSKVLLASLLCSSFLALTACGGGGGGSSGGSAEVTIEASPQTIDTGDRTNIQIQISDVHQDGIKLKIRYPTDLKYVTGTSNLTVDGDSNALTPDVDVDHDDLHYLVYYLKQSKFGQNNSGSLTLQLEAVSTTPQAEIAVDPDVKTTNSFDPAAPGFAGEAEVEVTVAG